jgi:2-polyprenyl-3-methyl-5-hydroxy-6-metoxy-1,4-benzoquinol methylase
MSLACWCGAGRLKAYSPDYRRCAGCGTLVTAYPGPVGPVKDDAQDFYGRDYWFSHQASDLAQPTITDRMRTDLSERATHWVRALLRHKVPPGRVLELGAAHGGFVSLLRQAGFDATGLELSPAIVDLARRTFEVPMLQGTLEEQDLPPESFDVIALFDVLEHLLDPVATLERCVRLLRPHGLLLVQTPKVPDGVPFDELVKRQDRFLPQFKRDEHLYLLTEEGARRLFAEAGAPHLVRHPAIFWFYDQFFVASPLPLVEITDAEVAARLTSPGQRTVHALVDLYTRWETLDRDIQGLHRDRAARLVVIEALDKQLKDCLARSEG